MATGKRIPFTTRICPSNYLSIKLSRIDPDANNARMHDTVKIPMMADMGAMVNLLTWKDTKSMGIDPESLPISKIKLSSVTGQVFKAKTREMFVSIKNRKL